jgi:hypothetical protein
MKPSISKAQALLAACCRAMCAVFCNCCRWTFFLRFSNAYRGMRFVHETCTSCAPAHTISPNFFRPFKHILFAHFFVDWQLVSRIAPHYFI